MTPERLAELRAIGHHHLHEADIHELFDAVERLRAEVERLREQYAKLHAAADKYMDFTVLEGSVTSESLAAVDDLMALLRENIP